MVEPAARHAAALRLLAPHADERAALLRFIAVLNQPGAQHCLHLAETEAGIGADLARDGVDIGGAFLVAADADGGWRGAAGLNREGESGWLFGPWARDEGDCEVRVGLLRALLAAPGLAQVRAFSNVRCDAVIAELEAAGFVRDGEVHVMEARRGTWRETAPAAAAPAIVDAADADEPAIAALHTEAFPRTWLAGDALLAHARERGRLLVAHDAAGGLLGSLCLSFNPALPEADVEFVAVQPGARRRGVGRALLQAALRQSFQDGGREVVYLCVNDVNVDALRLYGSSGFERLYSGASLRWLQNAGERKAGEPAASASAA